MHDAGEKKLSQLGIELHAATSNVTGKMTINHHTEINRSKVTTAAA